MFLVNYAVTAVVVVALLFAYGFVSVTRDASVPLGPWLAGGVAIAVVLPIMTYPFAATTWAAMDLVLRPLDPVEEAEAALHAAREPGPS